MRDEQIPFLEHAQLSCSQISDLIDCYVDGEMIVPLQNKFETHIETCAECKNAVEQTRIIIKAAHALRAKPIPTEVQLRLREALSSKLGLTFSNTHKTTHLTLIKS